MMVSPSVPPMAMVHSEAVPSSAALPLASSTQSSPASVPAFSSSSHPQGMEAGQDLIAPVSQAPLQSYMTTQNNDTGGDASEVLHRVQALQESTALASGTVPAVTRQTVQVMLPEAQLARLLGSLERYQYQVEPVDGSGLVQIEGAAESILALLAALPEYLSGKRQAVVLRDAGSDTVIGRYVYEPDSGHMVHTSIAPIGGGTSAFALQRIDRLTEGTRDTNAVRAEAGAGQALPLFSRLDGDRPPIAALFPGTALPLQEGVQSVSSSSVIPSNVGSPVTLVTGPLPSVPETITTPDTGGGVAVLNVPPVAVDDVFSTSEDTARIIPVSDLLINDSDTGQAIGIGGFLLSSTTLYGTLVNNGNGTLTYTPNANFFGPDSFSYTITDAGGLRDTASVSITVMPVNDAPSLSGLSAAVTFLENTVNASAQVIDSSVTLSDVDSSDFSGGTLTLSWQGGGLAQDSLSLSTAGTVSIVGADVRVGGVSVGTLTGNGAAGVNLVISFNSGATPARIDTLLEAVTYANSSDTPTASRTLNLTLTDGSGGTTSQSITVNVTAEADDQLLMGTASSETLTGGTGNDTIVGLASSDTLVGNDGNDILWGGMSDSTVASYNLTSLSTASNLKLWLDGNDLDGDGSAEGLSEAGLTGSAVGTWVDKSTNGNNATQGTAGNKPTYSTASVNGKSSLSFDGGDWLDTPTISGWTDQATLLAVAFQTVGGSSVFAGNNNYQIDIQSSRFQVQSGNITVGSFDFNSGWSIASLTRQTGSSLAYFNGIQSGTTNTSALGTISNSPYSIGARGDRTLPLVGNFSEVLLYNTALSDPDRQTIELYLAQKWGLNITTDNDRLSGGNGSDTLYGGSGNDTLDGGADADTLIGGAGADSMVGGLAADLFRFTSTTDAGTGSAKDIIADFSQGQGDRIDLSALPFAIAILSTTAFTSPGTYGQLRWSQSGSDTLIQLDSDGNGSANMEILLQGFTATNISTDDFLLPAIGITISSGATSIYGGVGNDTVTGTANFQAIYGWAGDDTIVSNNTAVTIYGGEGNDTLSAASVARLYGENGNDFLNGTAGGSSDLLSGGAGSDTLWGGFTGDTLNGGTESDFFYFKNAGESTTASRDIIQDFEIGVDKIALTFYEGIGTNPGEFLITYDSGNNRTVITDNGLTSLQIYLTGNIALTGSDFVIKAPIEGTSGNDTIVGIGNYETIHAGNGDDVMSTSMTAVHYYGGDGNDNISSTGSNEYFRGGAGNDTLVTTQAHNSSHDTLYGGSGDDSLSSKGGNDYLHGGTGSDTLNGEADKDTLTGGLGSDIFIFSNFTHSTNANPDLIADFENGSDQIKLTGLGFTALTDFETLSFAGGVTTLHDTNTNFAITFTGDVTGQLDNTDFIW